MMTPFIITFVLGLLFLSILFVIDLKHYLLPNIWVLLFAITGLGHHFLIDWQTLSWIESLTGGLFAGGFLLTIRYFANRYYQDETLGLGDVKLMMAGGLWLGPKTILIAISIGALLGALIGLSLILLHRHQTQEKTSFTKTTFPAGPGFILGLIIAFVLQFYFEL